ncbi:MAG: hypothetical protein HQL63_04125 [Magnetococcales bacterium]|nr:hypothetical protein [Magnetococcales bacterium]
MRGRVVNSDCDGGFLELVPKLPCDSRMTIEIGEGGGNDMVKSESKQRSGEKIKAGTGLTKTKFCRAKTVLTLATVVAMFGCDGWGIRPLQAEGSTEPPTVVKMAGDAKEKQISESGKHQDAISVALKKLEVSIKLLPQTIPISPPA